MGKIDAATFRHVLQRLEGQLVDAKEWRDVINTYFFRLTLIPDYQVRRIYA